MRMSESRAYKQKKLGAVFRTRGRVPKESRGS